MVWMDFVDEIPLERSGGPWDNPFDFLFDLWLNPKIRVLQTLGVIPGTIFWDQGKYGPMHLQASVHQNKKKYQRPSQCCCFFAGQAMYLFIASTYLLPEVGNALVDSTQSRSP
jgi:hypothetical protein